jgi:membrane protease YdiL (CAAX protease family)
MEGVTVDYGRPQQPPREPDDRKPGLRVPLRFWLLAGLIGLLVLITATGGIRNWWAHRVNDMTGGSKPADYIIGLVVGLLPVIAVGLGAFRSRGQHRFRRAWRMFYFGAVGFIVTYLLSPSLSRVITDSSSRHVFEKQAPSYLPGVFTGTVVWLLILAALIARSRSRRRARRAQPTDPRTGRVIDV